MPVNVVLLPLFVEVLLTLALLIWLVPLRQGDFSAGIARPDNISLHQPNWSPRTLQVGYCFSNQFELPVLFYVLTILSIITKHADVIFLVLAWIFVLSRLGHAFIHTTSNKVKVRGAIYGIGALVLTIMWVIYIVRVVLVLP
jgi:hypothetical protein